MWKKWLLKRNRPKTSGALKVLLTADSVVLRLCNSATSLNKCDCISSWQEIMEMKSIISEAVAEDVSVNE